ncbi:acetyltransferase [Komagataeibacter oboediens DSM 11826]|nr:acetyltransferase [Komagataeibacter oboediens DSM 11826]
MYYGKNAFSLLLRYTLAHEIEEWGWEIGDHTYGAKGSPIIIEAEYAGLKIGKYCSIAREVLMILGNHRPDTVTTYPFKNQCNFWPEATDATDDHSTKGDIVIGHDVWIGARANIMSGVTIGSGAIIATAAVVTGTCRLTPSWAAIRPGSSDTASPTRSSGECWHWHGGIGPRRSSVPGCHY